jgi:hypothetical protein
MLHLSVAFSSYPPSAAKAKLVLKICSAARCGTGPSARELPTAGFCPGFLPGQCSREKRESVEQVALVLEDGRQAFADPASFS